MPLNKKGKKIKKAMTKQYGKKKGEKVFYAMENSGKLKKVIKARGGDAARSDAASGRSAGRSSPSGGDKGRDPSKQYETKTNLSPGARQALQDQKSRARGRISPSTTATGNVLKTIGALGFGIPTQITGKAIDYSPMAFGVPKSTRAKKDMSPVDRGGDGSQTMIPQKPIMPIAETPIEKIRGSYKKPTFSSTGEFGYTVGFKKGGMLRQGKPKLAKKGWK